MMCLRCRLTHKDTHGVVGMLVEKNETEDVTRGGPPLMAVCGACSCKAAVDQEAVGAMDPTDDSKSFVIER